MPAITTIIGPCEIWDLAEAEPSLAYEYEYLTSHPYPINVIEVVDISLVELIDNPVPFWIEAVDVSGPEITYGELRSPLLAYDYYPPEAIDISGPEITSGELRVALITYDNYPPEAIDVSGPEITYGNLRAALVSYTHYPPEAIQISGPTITGGSLV